MIQQIHNFSEQNKELLLKGFNVSAFASHQDLYTLELLNEVLTRDYYHFFFIKSEQQVIGTFTLYISDGMINLKDYAIFPEFQGYGYGVQSFRDILDYCKQNYSDYKFSFSVVCDNIRAIHLYKKFGAKTMSQFDIKGIAYYHMEI